MKNTTTSVLTNTSFESDLALVYGPLVQTIPIIGLPAIVTHNIIPFNWDGTTMLLFKLPLANGILVAQVTKSLWVLVTLDLLYILV